MTRSGPTERGSPRRCSRCVLPETFPGIDFDSAGLCSLCRRAPAPDLQERRRAALRERLDRLFEAVRNRGPYDLLMAYSGGKDSSYTLALLRREYDLDILAVTVDNGFVPDHVLTNIRRIVDALGVDHVLVRPRADLMRRLFAAAAQRDIFAPSTLTRASSICTACIAVVKFSCLRRAIETEVPLVGYGWSPGQAPLTSALLKPTPAMLRRMQEVLLDPIQAVVGEGSRGWFLEERHFSREEAIPHLVSPLAIADYDEGRILDELTRLGWRPPTGVDANTTNCLLNGFANHVHCRRHRFHPYAFELAGLVRAGVLSREDAIARLEEPVEESLLERVRCRLGLVEPVGPA